MSGQSGAHGFNENHQRHLRIAFQYIDKLLSEAEHTMASAGSPSPFQEHVDDTTPVQRKVTHDYILRIREAMARIMKELEIPANEARSGAAWAATTNLMFVSISLSELTAERMRGYGALSEQAADALDGIRGEIGSLVDKLSVYLGKGGAGDLQQRLERETGDEVRLLREIERIITSQGLVEFRSVLTMLLDRFETAAFEIGVFGRVSSGKSSLLNYILQTDMLPVGVTPVTAIPTRISHGPVAQAGIEFAEAQPKSIPLSELAEYATEERNPSNKKHVTRIFVKLPAERLREGVTFVDTPGLGSLAVAGAEETVAYLPRCDLGIVLVDASSGLTQDDLVVMQALYQAGATATVLISKADLFSASDRDRMIDYVKTNLRTQLRIGPPVHAISVFGADAGLCDRWFEDELRPLLARHQELIVTAQKRKVGALREAVIAALERRLHIGAAGSPLAQAEPNDEAGEALRNGERILERAQGQAYFLTAKITKAKPDIIEAAAQSVAAALLESDAPDVAGAFGETLASVLAEHVTAVLHEVEETRAALLHALEIAATLSSATAVEELPKPTGMPAVDVTEFSKQIQIEKPVVVSLLGKSALVAHVRRKLENENDSALFDFLNLYANRLRRWMEQSIKSMRTAFTATADLQRAQSDAAQFANPADDTTLETDLRLLQNWSVNAR